MGSKHTLDTMEVLAKAFAWLHEHGYVSRKAAYDTGKEATTAAFRNAYDTLPEPADERYTDAREFRVWLAANVNLNATGWERDASAAALTAEVTANKVGLVISSITLLSTALKKAERAAADAAAAAASPSEWLGEVGERLTFSGKVTFTKPFNGAYGETVLVKVETADGDIVTTFNGGAFGEEVEVGDTVVFTATVKGHGEFRGIKETKVNRAAFGAKAPLATRAVVTAPAADAAGTAAVKSNEAFEAVAAAVYDTKTDELIEKVVLDPRADDFDVEILLTGKDETVEDVVPKTLRPMRRR